MYLVLTQPEKEEVFRIRALLFCFAVVVVFFLAEFQELARV